jgi:anti-sigma regulatory factor (Ser/Thr protein kinase)
MPQIELELPANVDAPARAREALRDIAGSMGADDRWRAELILTELVSNAVVHGGGGPVEVSMACAGSGVRGHVADAGSGILPGPSGGDDAEGGRGLFLVEEYSDRWGTTAGSSRVWFEVAAGA